jgi:CYTH domain-containing protein
MIEIEKTYLAKYLPEGLENYESKEIYDVFIPKEAEHPQIRVRKLGDKYEITKKQPIENDPSHQKEYTIPLTKKEFDALVIAGGKELHKIRYYYKYKGRTAEIDVYLGKLKGLVAVDFEFESIEQKDSFEIPDFCLVDVTHEKFIATGILCGKNYDDLKQLLDKHKYKKLNPPNKN